MITSTIKYGGALQIGDFIGIGDSYGMQFGWYSGNGKTGTIQYVTPWHVANAFNGYHKILNNHNLTMSARDRRGFSLDNIGKSFVLKHRTDRIVKITCPDDCFTGRDLQNYLEAKRILTDMKFIKL